MARNPPTRKYRTKKSGRDPVLSLPVGGLLRIRQVRSLIGRIPAHRRTLEALGLRHHQDEVVKKDHPALRGMLHQVRHFIQVTPEKEGK